MFEAILGDIIGALTNLTGDLRQRIFQCFAGSRSLLTIR